MRSTLAAVMFVAIGAAATSAAADTVFVLINSANGARRIESASLRQIYQGQRTHWPNRSRIRIVIPPDDAREMSYLASEVLRVGTSDRVARFYLERVFQQRAPDVPPQLSREAALAYVAREVGAVALLIDSTPPRVPPGVRVIPLAEEPTPPGN
jgi:hypothetical protein